MYGAIPTWTIAYLLPANLALIVATVVKGTLAQSCKRHTIVLVVYATAPEWVAVLSLDLVTRWQRVVTSDLPSGKIKRVDTLDLVHDHCQEASDEVH